MTWDEMKNRISLALKEPILQQGFEIICKENAELKKACDETQELLDKQIEATYKLDKENAELEAQIERMKCCGNCSHFKLDNSGLYPIYVCELTYPNRCKNHDKWEIKEK